MDSISLEPDAQPPNSRVPESWKSEGGRKGIEQIRLKSHLTMYPLVSTPFQEIRQSLSSLQGGLWVKMTEAATVATTT